MIVPGMLVCSSFLISVCMFIVSKALLISSATVIVRTGGVIWLNPFATVLFTVCSAATVERSVLYPCRGYCMDELIFSTGCIITWKRQLCFRHLEKVEDTGRIQQRKDVSQHYKI